MTDQSIDTLAATIRAGLDAEAEDAQHIPGGQWWVEERDSRFWGDVRDAEVACSQGTVAILPDDQGGHLKAPHIARQDPETVLRRVARNRRLLDLLLAEKHHEAEDDFYSCRALPGLPEWVRAAPCTWDCSPKPTRRRREAPAGQRPGSRPPRSQAAAQARVLGLLA